jgi:hypothetical protein
MIRMKDLLCRLLLLGLYIEMLITQVSTVWRLTFMKNPLLSALSWSCRYVKVKHDEHIAFLVIPLYSGIVGRVCSGHITWGSKAFEGGNQNGILDPSQEDFYQVRFVFVLFFFVTVKTSQKSSMSISHSHPLVVFPPPRGK